MKPNPSWNRLVTAARLVPPDLGDASAPSGFATRVVAMARAQQEQEFPYLLGRFAWRALGVSALVMMVSVAANFSPVMGEFQSETFATVTDPVVSWLDLS